MPEVHFDVAMPIRITFMAASEGMGQLEIEFLLQNNQNNIAAISRHTIGICTEELGREPENDIEFLGELVRELNTAIQDYYLRALDADNYVEENDDQLRGPPGLGQPDGVR